MIEMKTNIRVNNTTHELSVDSRLTLLDALRDLCHGAELATYIVEKRKPLITPVK